MKKPLFLCAVLLCALFWQYASAFRGMGSGVTVQASAPLLEGTVKVGSTLGSGQVWLYDASNNPVYKLSGNQYLYCASGNGLATGSSTTDASASIDLYWTRAGTNQWKATSDNATTYADVRVRSLTTSLAKSRAATQTVTDTTTLATDNTLSVSVLAAKKYQFKIVYYFTTVNSSGFKIDLNGGDATATTLQASLLSYNLATPALLGTGTSETQALATAIGITASGTNVQVIVEGFLLVNGAGTFIPRFAQNAETGAAESVIAKVGSFMVLQEIP